jgi:hypothetical protein
LSSEIEKELDNLAQSQGEPESASAKIRDEIRKMVGQGVDLTNKDRYTPILHELEQKYSVKYPVVKKAFDKVMREAGNKLPEPQISQRTVGGVQMSITPKPKDKPAGQEQKQDTTSASIPQKEQQEIIEINGKKYAKTDLGNGQTALIEVKGGKKLSRELAKKMFKTMHKSGFGFLERAIEAYWKVKVQPPEESEFDENAELWAEVCDEYGIALPQVMVLASAGMSTAQLMVLPVLAARGEVLEQRKKKEQSEKSKEKEKVS